MSESTLERVVSWGGDQAEDEDFAYIRKQQLESQHSRRSVAFSVIQEIEDEMADDVTHAEKTRHYVTVSSRW